MLTEISGLIHHRAVFLPADPPRNGRIAFWPAEGQDGPERPEKPEGPEGPEGYGGGPAWDAEELTVITPELRRATVHALVLPVGAALPVLTRARAAAGSASASTTADSDAPSTATTTAGAFWGAATLLALRFAARGLLLPGLSPAGHDAWRIGPLDATDLAEVRELAAAMPPQAHCVPLDAGGRPATGDAEPAPDLDGAPPRLPAPEPLLRAFLDAVADTLPRSPAAPAAAGGPAYAAAAPVSVPAEPPRTYPALRAWAAEVAAVHDAGVRISLRVELRTPPGSEATPGDRPPAAPGAAPAFRAVLQIHGLADTALVADAADVWAASGAAGAAFPPRARTDALRALRRAARVWPPLTPLLGSAVPDSVDLADEEVAELLGEAAEALAADGVQVHWPRGLARSLTSRAVVDTPGAGTGTGLLSPATLLSFDWRHSLGDQPGDLTPAELDRLAEARRPLVRLRDQWVLVDPAAARRARARRDRPVTVTAADALAAVLTGSAEIDGVRVDVTPTGALARLKERLTADPARAALPQAPAGLRATLRDYQLRGLAWLDLMTSLGLGACLADDMGLGKTVTLIALHLHRDHPDPTLVVCPASLLGNWQREIEKFAPGTPVRRYHGPDRTLDDLPGGFVLTTYATMRADAPELAATRWGMVVADEAQHVKNPRSATARALRTVPAPARVALTGTPVENNLSELWALLDWTTPGLLGRLGTFRTRYAEPVESGRDPRAAARLASLVRPFLLRRKKSDPGIAPELPPKTETDHAVPLSPEQAALYEAVVRETLAAIAEADGMERRGLVVKLLTSLKQICNHPAQFTRDAAAGPSGKLELLDELLDTVLAEGGSVLVFTQYVAMARILEKHLTARGIASQLLHGGTPVARREELVDRFQSGEVPVFLLSLKAAGTGLNLTRAGHVVHYDRWWNPAVEEQATDRAYRIGQTQPVQVHRIIAEGTVEDRIAELLARKQALADSVLAGGEGALTELTDAELAELVALRPAHMAAPVPAPAPAPASGSRR
ncbi:DEAD/DEAH box helicase [Streptomyces sp. NBC_00249]|uniref:DEAD/DEAH box helicase n=1 Tax=Streptomyces sp. NBC_00249 TaxID=2975690 RepID=UPI00225132B6|nr:DEAD/DEAH box helicase [Streptomyces sp. NBC_00249]MCX5197338.1 DEAD/DEAH box helicase [Streptomyces sp. NBC_00249]